MSVIDARLRISQCFGVFTHDEILAEMGRQIDGKALKGKDVAAHLNIPPPRISEMLKGTRRIQPHEMAPLAQFLGMVEPETPVETAEVINIWERIPADRRPQAIDVLKTFAKDG